MPTIVYIEHNGAEHRIEATLGGTVMSTAVDNLVPGIDADCGGGCACATCHVVVHADWIDKVGTPEGMEESMLGMKPDRERASRLSCQIPVTEELDGLIVWLPEFQF